MGSKSEPVCKICLDFNWESLERKPMNQHPCSELRLSADGGCYRCQILRTALETLYGVDYPPETMVGFTVRRYEKLSRKPDVLFPELYVQKPGRSGYVDLYRTRGEDKLVPPLFQLNLLRGELNIENGD